jgi:formiminoglutamase
MNWAEDDFWKDGVIKTHTCWNVPVYSAYPSEDIISRMIAEYYHPYHAQLSELAKKAKIGIDCHTMAAVAPQVAPDSGKERPPVCLSNAESTCPQEWIESLAHCLSQSLSLRILDAVDVSEILFIAHKIKQKCPREFDIPHLQKYNLMLFY